MYYINVSWAGLIGTVIFLLVAWLSDGSATKDRLPASRRGILITGCDTGFGHLLAKHLDSLGATVFAGCLDAEGEGGKALKEGGSKRMHVLQMDVTSDSDIQNCLEYVQEIMGKPGQSA